jgi:hypothetical protein
VRSEAIGGRGMRRRVLAVLAIATCAAVAARVAVPGQARPVAAQRPVICGKERWLIKTLQDRPTLLSARATTVANLVALPRPTQLPATRLPFERRIYSLIAAVTLVKAESDQDLHLVLEDGAQHMIAEASNPDACTATATNYRRRQMRDARSAVRLCAQARVVGVGFWDFKHGQTGVAPNAIELHPILGFACLTP